MTAIDGGGPTFIYRRTTIMFDGEERETIEAFDRDISKLTFLASERAGDLFEYRDLNISFQFHVEVRQARKIGYQWEFNLCREEPYDDKAEFLRCALSNIVAAFSHWQFGPDIDADVQVKNIVNVTTVRSASAS